jgi:hypothetical protein
MSKLFLKTEKDPDPGSDPELYEKSDPDPGSDPKKNHSGFTTLLEREEEKILKNFLPV